MQRYLRAILVVASAGILSACSLGPGRADLVLMHVSVKIPLIHRTAVASLELRADECGDIFRRVDKESRGDHVVVWVWAERTGICPTFPIETPSQLLYAEPPTAVLVVHQPGGTTTEHRI